MAGVEGEIHAVPTVALIKQPAGPVEQVIFDQFTGRWRGERDLGQLPLVLGFGREGAMNRLVGEIKKEGFVPVPLLLQKLQGVPGQ